MSGGCPDCPARPIDGELAHDDDCPVGRDIDRQLFDDRAYVQAHPGALERRRPPFWSEVVTLRTLGEIPPVGEVWGDIVVRRGIADGVRFKRYDELCILVPNDDDVVAAILEWARRHKRSA